jgi:uncharacterized LabA/DUF88 family protein
MAANIDPAPTNDDEIVDTRLIFREQADGRRVARLPQGKVVLVAAAEVDRVRNGEQWHVRLRHRDTFAIADLVERITTPAINPVLSASVAKLIQTRPFAEPVARTPPPAAPPVPRPVVEAASTASTRPAVAGPQPAPVRIHPSRVVGMNDRVAMFIDGANMDLACRLAGYFVDYRKARQFFLAHGLFYAAFYYIADFTASDPLQQRYLDFLAHSDYIVRRKAVKVIWDQETGQKLTKANVDTELVLDLINTAENYDLAFLFSGDSDSERAVDLLRSRGKRVYVVTSRLTGSRELSYVADKPIFFLEDFKVELQRDDVAGGRAGSGQA